ncbi:LacI family DNA-binding transcriptional regulator [Planomonospora venezuelensis]|uniref:DNA-binding LacI/PurR family transcriptional regulator n=1 Tax=Planomonospora venezuelensis TaxID=1999 RepID=A0A841CZS5_PLAVE|nr:LacI family DNA-binding transcriptional regulator [Planomonospora venezuelensis]MBB5961445.1 DNA-binding LacI/PurR family transcriptional regulator [Planomonospora venezuelensis]GIN03191.1 LacI family transcriptional regulator [Planomonospora venezuelensis]
MTDVPTLAQVAAEAGVSPATASRVLTGSVRVATSTRRQVHDAISRLGYVRHRAPRGGAGRRCDQTVTVVVCEPAQRLFTEPFYARMITAAEEVLAGHGIPLTVMTVPSAGSTIATPQLVAGGVDGVLLIGARERHPLVVTLAASGIPVRSAGRLPDGIDLPYVDMDNHDGGRQAAEHLLLGGRRAIAAIAGPPGLPAARDRLDGFTRTLSMAGMAGIPVAYGDFTHSSGVHAAQWLLRRMPRLDAIFAASDVMAAAAVQTLRRAGRRVPDDVAVIGFDDAPIARRTSPTLTTVRQPVEEYAALATRLLLRTMSTGEPSRNNPVLPTELVVRESA